MKPAVRYTSSEMKIGKHWWRLYIYFDPIKQRNFVEYQWRPDSSDGWQGQRQWKGYDFNRYNLGLPSGLSRLYEAEREPIRQRLSQIDPPEPAALPIRTSG